jgi:colanic acid/amylovoran biosynthesis glycosyltransferase
MSASTSPLGPPPEPLAILYVLNAFPVLSETFISNEIRAMRRMGHRIVPLSLSHYTGPCQPEDEPMKADTLHLTEVSTARAAAFAAMHPRGMVAALRFANRQTGLRLRSLLRAAARVALAARQQGCSHLHAHFANAPAATAIAAAAIADLTCSFIGHGFDIYGPSSDLPLKLASADVVFATCNDTADHFRRMAPGANARTVTCGVDPDRFLPATEAGSNGRLLAIGRLVEQKGYPVLFDALSRLPADRRPAVDIVGGGPLEEGLKQLAINSGVGDSVRFLGCMPSAWIAREGPRYQGFLAPYVVCKNNDKDTSPVAVKEALAMGLPVVASRLMGLKESVNTSCGRHVEPGDAAELADAIAWLAGLTAEQRQALGAAGRQHVLANFTLAAQAAGNTAAIREVQAARSLR